MNQSAIDRKRQIAEALRSRQAPQGQYAGRFYVAPSPFEYAANAAGNLAGAFADRSANKQQDEFDDQRRAELAKALQGLTGVQGPGANVSPQQMAATGALAQGPLDQLQGAVSGLSASALTPERQQALIKVGQDEDIYDPNSRQIVRQGQPKPGKLISVMGQNGPTLVPESEAAGMTPVRSSGVTVNNNQGLPKPPTGFMWNEDQTSVVPIPGGPAEQEAAAADEAATKKQQLDQQNNDVVTQEIQRVFRKMDDPSMPETGMVGNLLKNVPGTDSHAVSNLLKTIKGNIGFDRLQQMRDSSPTGGALGQVSERELSTLESVKGSLEQSQSESDLKFNLARLYNTYLDTIHGPDAGPPRMPLPDINEASNEPTIDSDDPLSGLTPEQRQKYGL